MTGVIRPWRWCSATVRVDVDDLRRLLQAADDVATRAAETYGWARQMWTHNEVPTSIIHADTAAHEYRAVAQRLRFDHPEVH